MIVLAAGNTLQGVSDAATKVTYTVFGMTLIGGVEAYAPIAQGQFAAATAAIYTAPSPGQVFIKSIHLTNNDVVDRTFALYVNGTAAANKISGGKIAAGGSAVYVDGVGWVFYTANGAVVQNPYTSQPAFVSGGALGTAGCKGATHDREVITETNTTLTTTGQVYMQAIWLAAGTVVSTISIWSATTGAGTPTHCNAGLYDSAGNQLATGTDLTTTAWAANTRRNFTMQSAYAVPTSGLYYIAYSTTATTCPTIKGNTARTGGQISLATPVLCGISGTAYATGNMPATLVLPSAAVLTSMYAEVS